MSFEAFVPYFGPRGERIVEAIRASIAYVGQHVRGDGGVLAPPAPRLLENALVLHCLKRASLLGRAGAAAEARRFLVDNADALLAPNADVHPVARVIETWLTAMALDRPVPVVDLAAPALAEPAFRRRGLLLGALALEVKAPMVDADAVRGRLHDLLSTRLAARDTAKPWSAAEEASLFVINFHGARPDRDPLLDVAHAAVLAAQGEDGSVAQNPLSTVLAAWALSVLGDVAATNRALAWLEQNQKNGTWRFCATEIWDTALLARTFITGGVAADVVANARRFLVAEQNEDGGWGYSVGRDSDIDTTSLALMVLGDDDTESVNRGIAHLLSRRDGDGLWPTWIDKSDPVASDVAAHAVHALAHRGVADKEVDDARQWLALRFDDRGGGWRADWYDNRYYAGYEIGIAVGRRHEHTRALAAQAIEQQNADGGFSPTTGKPSAPSPSSPAATGCALALIGEHVGVQHPAFLRGVDYLLDTQLGSGTWPGPTGMYGPRPFKSDYPMQTHALAFLGLATALKKLGRGPERRRTRRVVVDDVGAAATGGVDDDGVGFAALVRAQSLGLIDDNVRATLQRIGATALTRMMFPSFSPEWLRIATLWTIFTFVFDDELDGYDDERIARARTDEIFRGRGGALALALAETQQEVAALSTPRQAEAFRSAVADYFSAMTWQTRTRANPALLTPALYRRMRPYTAAMMTFVRLLATATRMTIAQESHLLTRRAFELAAWLPALDNDIVSAKKELAAGEIHNAVLLRMRSNPTRTLAEAVADAKGDLERGCDRFSRVLRRLADGRVLEDEQLDALAALVDGCHAWQARTARYHS